TINAVPYVYLIVSAALRNLDPALEEAARINGAAPLRILRTVSLPAIRPALISAALLVTITSLGVYSIPSVIATTAKLDVLTTRTVFLLNRDFPPKLAEAQALGIIMLLAVLALWWLEVRMTRGGKAPTVGGRATSTGVTVLGGWTRPFRLGWLPYLAVATIVRNGALIIVSLHTYSTPEINRLGLNFGNSHQALFANGLVAGS